MSEYFAVATIRGDLSAMPFIRGAMILDRRQARQLLRDWSKLKDCDAPGWFATIKSLAAVLARRDWELISISAKDADTLRNFGATVGIAEFKTGKLPKARLTPIQKYNQQRGIGRRS